MKSPLQVKRSTHDIRWSKTMLHLSESDLRFLVETVATNRSDYDHIANLIRDKEDLLEPMLDDPKLTERLFREEEALVRVTPHMLFSVLLRRLRSELEKRRMSSTWIPRGNVSRSSKVRRWRRCSRTNKHGTI